MGSLPLATMAIEIPPGYPVLHCDNCSLWSNNWSHARRHAGQAVRLQGEEDHIGNASGGEIVGHDRPGLQQVICDQDLDATILHSAQMRTSGNKGDILSGQLEECAGVSPDSAGPYNYKLHAHLRGLFSNSEATMRRWTLPVAVRGICSTM